ncbi:MAG: winged helix-turn-helix domain-containing protein [Acidobacteriota bacterium]|nr:winged helix-turn-helix domain-containing protein [Acidobacteriota bacterium]
MPPASDPSARPTPGQTNGQTNGQTPDQTNDDQSNATREFRFGSWTARPSLNRLLGEAGETVSLEPRLMRVLVSLARAEGRPVSRESLLQAVWGDVMVTEDSLTLAVSELRKLLGDDPRRPSYIETIRKVGYRLLPPVHWLEPAPHHPETDPLGTVPAGTLELSPDPPPAPSPEPASSSPPPGRRLGALPPAPLQRRLQILLLALIFVTALGVLWWKLSGAPDPGHDDGPRTAAPAENLPPSPATTVLTTYPGLELGPALSPDGRQLAFVRLAALGEHYRIFLKNLNTETPMELGGDMLYQGMPNWSQDGSRLAFVGCTSEGCAIYLQPLPGQDPRRLFELQALMPGSLSWSPDGSFLAFADRRGPSGAARIHRLSLPALEVKPLTRFAEESVEDFYPSLSPDGRRLAFARGLWRVDAARGLPGLVGQVFVLELDSGRLRRLTEKPQEIFGLDWQPGGDSLVYAALDESLGSALLELPLDGSPQRQLFHSDFLIRHPQVHRPTGRILFEHWNGDQNVWRFEIDPSVERQRSLAPEDGERYLYSTRFDAGARFSPDGSRIAFISSRTGSHEVWIRDKASEALYQLTDFPDRSPQPPRWSPDGRRLAFTVHPGEDSHLYIADAQALTVPQRPTVTWPGNLRLSSWSRDGRSLYTASDRSGSWQLWKIDATTGHGQQLTTAGGTTAAEAPHPKGSTAGLYLYFTRPKQPGLWRRPLDQFPETPDSEPAELFAEDLNTFDDRNWGLKDTDLFYCYRTAEGAWLRLRDLDSGAQRTLTQLPWIPSASHAMDLSPNGRELLLGQVEDLSADVLALEPPD